MTAIQKQKFYEPLMASAVIVGIAFLAGSKRCIEYFPGSSRKGMLISAGISSLFIVGSGLKFHGKSTQEQRRKIICSIAGIILINTAAHLWSKRGLSTRGWFRLAGLEAAAYLAIEKGSKLWRGNVSVLQQDDENPGPGTPAVQGEADLEDPYSQIAERKAPIDLLPHEVLVKIFLYMNSADSLQSLALSCQKFNEVIQAPAVQHLLMKQLVIERFAFGLRDWQRFFGDVGEAPDLPDDIVDILQSYCPFWQSRKVWDTHILVLIPQSIDGRPFNLNLLEEIIQNPREKEPLQFSYYNQAIANSIGSTEIEGSYWVLMTKYMIPVGVNIGYDEQQEVIRRYSEEYDLPRTLEAATSILMHFLKTGSLLYQENYARCQEDVAVGRFSSEGLYISDGKRGLGAFGIAAVRRF